RSRYNIIYKHSSGPWLYVKSEGVAKSDRPDRAIFSARRAVKRVVGGNGSIGIDAKQLALQTAERLSILRDDVIAHPDVKFAIRPEMQGASVVSDRPGEKIVNLQNRHFTARRRHVAARRKATYAVVRPRGRGGVINIDELIPREVRVRCHSEQAVLTIGVN